MAHQSISEAAGTAVGWAAAPLFAVTSALRRGRTFHPRGELFHADARVHEDVAPDDLPLARRLEGDAFVRLSDALSKHGPRWPDVLGCAVRFVNRANPDAGPVDDGEQDLLFATIKRPWTMPFAPFTTDTDDFLANDYFGVGSFAIPAAHGESRAWLRLHPERASREPVALPPRPTPSERRRASLAASLARGEATFVLGMAPGPRGPWRPLLRIVLVAEVVDPPALGFDPFRAGRGIRARGFVHALRHGAYAASQTTRTLVESL